MRLLLNGLQSQNCIIMLTVALHIHLLKYLIISQAVSKHVLGSKNFHCEKTTIKFFTLEKSEECNLMRNSVFEINSFIKLYFNYYSLLWMFCNNSEIEKINKIRERC